MTLHTLCLSTLCVAALALPAARAATLTAQPLDFRPGNAKQAALLARVPEASEIVTDRFGLASVDLDGDGKPELVLRADSGANCGSGGCLTVVLQERGNSMVTLLSQNLHPGLGVTDQKLGAFRALAALDAKGGIAVGDRPGTPLYGKPMVYAMSGQAQAAAAPAASTAPQAPAAAEHSSAGSAAGSGIDVVGVRLGMPLKDAIEILKRHNPGITPWRPTQGEYALLPGTTFTVAVAGEERARSAGGSLYIKEKIVVEAAPGPVPPRVTGIYRRLSFEGNEMARENILKSLTDKYGSPVNAAYGGEGTMLWHFDGQGRPFRPAGACDHNVVGRIAATSTANIGENNASGYLRSIAAMVGQLERSAPNCQTFVRAQLFVGRNPGLVMGIDLYASDEVLRTQRFRATANHMTGLAQQKGRQEVQDAAKRGTAKF
jgi:hypothetical protein